MGKEESTHTYNIIQLDEASEDYDVGQFPAVHATLEELRFVGEFPPPPRGLFAIRDMLDWLGAFFGFQSDSVKNQREHIVLLLANHQMQRQHSSEYVHRLDSKVVQAFRKKLLKNYILWCSFLNKEHNLWLPKKNTHRFTQGATLLLPLSSYMGGSSQHKVHARMHLFHIPSHGYGDECSHREAEK